MEKRLLIFALSLACYCGFAQRQRAAFFLPAVSGVSLISTNAGAIIQATATRIAWTTNGSLGGSTVSPGRTAVNPSGTDPRKSGSSGRIRLSGTVYAASVLVLDPGTTHQIKFKVFRFSSLTSTNTYDLVGESELLSVSTGSNYFVFANPITGVHEQDLKGIFIASGATQTKIGINTGIATDNFAAGDLTGTGISITSGVGGQIQMEFYMSAPVLAYTGDSIIAGHNTGSGNYWMPFVDTNASSPGTFGTILSSIPFCASTNGESLVSYCNYGRGAQTLFWVATNGIVFATNDDARVAWVHCLINDITPGVQSWATVSNNLQSIRTAWPQDRPLFFAECLPDNAVNTTIASTIRQYNTNMIAWAATNNCTVALMHDAFATNNANNGNLKDYMADAYAQNSDAPHLSQNGVSNYVWIMNTYLKTVIVTPP